MTARAALKAARAAGVEVRVDGDDLLLEASTPPPDAVLELLSLHKPEVIALLRARSELDCRGLAGALRRTRRYC